MKLLFDQNISHKILRLLPQEYSTSSCIKLQQLMNAADKETWEFSRQNKYKVG